jgi:hypothetical protein
MGRGGGETDNVCAWRQAHRRRAVRRGRGGVDHDDLGPAVAIRSARRGATSSNTSVCGKGDPADAAVGVGGELDGKRARFDGIAQRAMSVSRGRVFVPGGDRCLRSLGAGQRAVHRGALPRRCVAGGRAKSARQPQARRETRAAGGHLDKRATADAAPPDLPQICFSGIWTTSPSSASETLSWQVRRDRSGFGS